MVNMVNANMPGWMANFFVFVGFLFAGFIAFFGLFLVLATVTEWFEHKKYEYKRKHRFNKPPLAKCYCKDCEYFAGKSEEGRCYGQNGLYVSETCFCWRATPRIEDPDA